MVQLLVETHAGPVTVDVELQKTTAYLLTKQVAEKLGVSRMGRHLVNEQGLKLEAARTLAECQVRAGHILYFKTGPGLVATLTKKVQEFAGERKAPEPERPATNTVRRRNWREWLHDGQPVLVWSEDGNRWVTGVIQQISLKNKEVTVLTRSNELVKLPRKSPDLQPSLRDRGVNKVQLRRFAEECRLACRRGYVLDPRKFLDHQDELKNPRFGKPLDFETAPVWLIVNSFIKPAIYDRRVPFVDELVDLWPEVGGPGRATHFAGWTSRDTCVARAIEDFLRNVDDDAFIWISFMALTQDDLRLELLDKSDDMTEELGTLTKLPAPWTEKSKHATVISHGLMTGFGFTEDQFRGEFARSSWEGDETPATVDSTTPSVEGRKEWEPPRGANRAGGRTVTGEMTAQQRIDAMFASGQAAPLTAEALRDLGPAPLSLVGTNEAGGGGGEARYWSDGYQVGDVVRIKGLQGAAHLNGLLGTLESRDQETGRWKVGFRDTGAKLIRAENFEMEELQDGSDVGSDSHSRSGDGCSVTDEEESPLALQNDRQEQLWEGATRQAVRDVEQDADLARI
eukprot:gnl/TRDRNA2_/TRDRNA2_190194_c0_seq1.p1 gnl/TRDRNA2_/TRDRNA2_190194_c0~~gnl/TRDRNA2_/TRDRNA2_190194_c0_seq1.p1  ORF type:complete len:569 (+),score=115.03 gnl/TRDRNA2_/TRDRNA2_190194_c0_seq1:143-1849(+)